MQPHSTYTLAAIKAEAESAAKAATCAACGVGKVRVRWGTDTCVQVYGSGARLYVAIRCKACNADDAITVAL